MGFVMQAAGGILGGVGQILSGQSTASADKYNGQIALANSTIAQRNASQAGEAGEVAAANSEMRTRANVGSIKTNQAASGIDVNQGSAVDIQNSAAKLGKLDALTIRSNAAKQAYGYQTESMNDVAQSELDKHAASSALVAGDVGGASTILGTSGDAYDNFVKYQKSAGGGFTA